MCFGGRKTREERKIWLKVSLFGFPDMLSVGRSAPTAVARRSSSWFHPQLWLVHLNQVMRWHPRVHDTFEAGKIYFTCVSYLHNFFYDRWFSHTTLYIRKLSHTGSLCRNRSRESKVDTNFFILSWTNLTSSLWLCFCYCKCQYGRASLAPSLLNERTVSSSNTIRSLATIRTARCIYFFRFRSAGRQLSPPHTASQGSHDRQFAGLFSL